MEKRKPLYEIIYSKIKEELQHMPDGSQLPSIDRLCEDFGASKTVLREAITALEKDGLVVRRQGLGTFVVKESGVVHTGIEYLRGLNRIISSSGKSPKLSFDHSFSKPAEKEIAMRLERPIGETVVIAERTYEADGIAAIFARTYFAAELIDGGAEKLLSVLKTSQSQALTLFDLLEAFFQNPIKYAIAEIESENVDSEIAERLHMKQGDSIVLLKEVHRNHHNTALLYSEDYINTKIFRIHVLRKKI